MRRHVHATRRAAWVAAAIGMLGLTDVVRSQVPTVPPRWPSPQSGAQQPTSTTTTQQPSLLPNPLEVLLRNAAVHPRGSESLPDPSAFVGFPALAPPGFVFPGGQLPVPFVTTGAPTAGVAGVPRSDNAWPTWLGTSVSAETFTADVAILAQTTDYVWLREPGESVYTPLAFWDRFRVVQADTTVEIRGSGQYVMVFQRGATLRVLGRARMTVQQLDDEASTLDFAHVTRALASAQQRPLRIRVGTAGELDVVASRVSFTRDGGLVECANIGPSVVTLRTEGRTVEIPAGHAVMLLPDARVPGDGPQLAIGGDVVTGRDGRVLSAEGRGAGGAVDWSGAKFELSNGSRLRIDPLGGADFPSSLQRDS